MKSDWPIFLCPDMNFGSAPLELFDNTALSLKIQEYCFVCFLQLIFITFQ